MELEKKRKERQRLIEKWKQEGKDNVEIVELPRPDCGDIKSIANQRDSMLRMMMEEMRSSHGRYNDNDIECENLHNEKYSKCYVLVIKCSKDFDFAAHPATGIQPIGSSAIAEPKYA